MLKQFHGLFLQLAHLGIPLAVLVSGQCLGGAMELALAAHFIFADHTARLGQPEINLGVFPPPASLLLPLRIGTTRAEELLITGRIISGVEAAEMDLVTRLYPDRPAMEEGFTQWLEEAILPKSASSLRQGVKAARTQTNHFLERLLPAIEQQYVESLMATHDANEGIAAFLEQREPQWENR
jgi:cyclohexa-1,5-dienecarbonyl-CoA hydratase